MAKSAKDKEDTDRTSEVASILRSEIQKQVKFATDTKPAAASSVKSSEIDFESALGSLFRSKDTSK